MEAVDFLPLGSVVILNGTVKKVIIGQRAVRLGKSAGGQYYDYGAYLYPEGIVASELVYFNADDINRVVFKGFTDDDDTIFVEQLNDAIADIDDEGEETAAEPDKGPDSDGSDSDPFAAVRGKED